MEHRASGDTAVILDFTMCNLEFGNLEFGILEFGIVECVI